MAGRAAETLRRQARDRRHRRRVAGRQGPEAHDGAEPAALLGPGQARRHSRFRRRERGADHAPVRPDRQGGRGILRRPAHAPRRGRDEARRPRALTCARRSSMFLALAMSMAVSAVPAPAVTAAQFRELMETVAAGWNAGDARKASECFTDDALYLEPPDKQFYTGRPALYEFFGGPAK